MVSTEDYTKPRSGPEGGRGKRVLRLLVPFSILFLFCDAFLLNPWIRGSAEKGRLKGGEAGRGLYELTLISHYHTLLSDGGGGLAETVEAALRAGGDLLIPTDHNRLQEGDLPVNQGGVLILPGMEISAREGHILAINPPAGFKGKGRGAGECTGEIKGGGGLSFIAHPFKGRSGWKGRIPGPFDGMEVLNLDSILKENIAFPFYRPLRAILIYPFSPFSAVASLSLKEEEAFSTWDSVISSGRTFVGISGTDAHSRIDLPAGMVRFPSYTLCFSLCQNRVILREPLSGEPEEDMSAILTAIRGGNLYMAFPFLSEPEGFILYFQEKGGGAINLMGDEVDFSTPGDIVVEIPGHVVGTPSITLMRNGDVIEMSESRVLRVPVRREGAYRVSVRLKRSTPAGVDRYLPWIYSNPLYIFEQDHGKDE